MRPKTLSRLAWSALGIACVWALHQALNGLDDVQMNRIFVGLVVGWVIAGWLQERAS